MWEYKQLLIIQKENRKHEKQQQLPHPGCYLIVHAKIGAIKFGISGGSEQGTCKEKERKHRRNAGVTIKDIM